MKILLLGEYSNVHATLADGLRKLGHQVTVLSNGDFWKNYPRDIDLVRKPGKKGGIIYLAKLLTILPKLRGYDIVQLINPMFLELKAERIFPHLSLPSPAQQENHPWRIRYGLLLGQCMLQRQASEIQRLQHRQPTTYQC